MFLYGLFFTKGLGWQEAVTGTISAIWKKIVVFLAGLTLGKAFIIGLKRWFIDHVISKHINEQFIPPIKEPGKYWWHNLSGKQKAAMFLPVSVVAVGGAILAGLSNVTAFAAIKGIVIGFFKTLWVVSGVAWNFLTNTVWFTWIYPIIEILVFSWLIDWIKKIPVMRDRVIPWLNNRFMPWFREHIIKRFDFLHRLIAFIGDFLETKVHTPIKHKLNKAGVAVAKKTLKNIPSSTAGGIKQCRWEEGDNESPH